MHARNMHFYVYLSLILKSVKKKDANRALTYQAAKYLKTLLELKGTKSIDEYYQFSWWDTFKLENSNDWLTLRYIHV